MCNYHGKCNISACLVAYFAITLCFTVIGAVEEYVHVHPMLKWVLTDIQYVIAFTHLSLFVLECLLHTVRFTLVECQNSNVHTYHSIRFISLLLGSCYVYCVLINVLNHLHRCEECYIQLVVDDGSNADAYI